MNSHEHPGPHLHEDPVLFRETLSFTAARTAFSAGLIEKDYFCTVLLEHLAATGGGHVFKGGTCLAKVYCEFYRLSEDMDFAIPMPVTASRADRSKMVAAFRDAVARVPKDLACFNAVDSLRGVNASTQYVGALHYVSHVNGQPQTLQVEVSLREPLLRPPADGMARTLLLNPVSDKPAVAPLKVRCIGAVEALAEKFRAAMTRREVAIRDFYDIAHVVRSLGIRTQDDEFMELVRQKLAVPGNEPVSVGPDRLTELRRQLDGRLKPVLRQRDFDAFDLDTAFAMVAQVARAVLSKQ